MSKLETNTIDTVSGTTNLVVGSTNSSTVTFENGSPTGHMYPAFEVYLSSDQTLSDATTTKVQFNEEIFDTDNCYDPTTNYRFTPTVAGKYYVSSGLKLEAGSDVIQNVTLFIYKNGSSYKRSVFYTATHQPDAFDIINDAIIEMNGSSDYLEIFVYVDVSSGTPRCDADTKACHFKAFRIGA